MTMSEKGSRNELEQRLAEERALRSEAERACRDKDEFLSTLGHELRAPLNAILGWSRLLESGRLAHDEVQRGGQTIARNVRALAQLVDDLLDLSGMVSGKIRLDAEETDIGEIVEAALETLQGTADAKGVVQRKALPTCECLVFGDPHRLQQVIWNMLSNAIKFTPRGGTVTATLAQVDGDWEVRITDTGIGLAAERLPSVFDPFKENSSGSRREYPGLGLGLAIAKQIVELHGGRVRAASAGEGRGATFYVLLPRVAPREQSRDGRGRARGTGPLDLEGVRVLIVDDEMDTLELTRRVLGSYHAMVLTATSVDSALSVLNGFQADVLISDLAMPGRDGYELIRSVRESVGPDQLPAAALTAFARPEDAVRAQDAGFQIHLAKPVEPDELVRVVAHLAGRN
ncbi:MAG TPA: hybrid sensor histidine kinase/response regulator [Steroidobacteraceae bacterium]|nr:hybrid sensor histidine kinase/response regulator [Steroidobacteraceae bacterium]